MNYVVIPEERTMSSNTKVKVLGVVTFGLMLTGGASAQVGPGLRFVPRPDGLTVTGPASGQFFRMLVTGRDAGRMRTKKKYWFRADGIPFEFFSEENTRFLPTDIPRSLDDRVVLDLCHSAWLRRNGSADIKPRSLKLSNGMRALTWTYDKFVANPNPVNGVERGMFLIVAGPGHVFGLFASVPPGSTERATRDLLTRTLGTLTFREELEN